MLAFSPSDPDDLPFKAIAFKHRAYDHLPNDSQLIVFAHLHQRGSGE